MIVPALKGTNIGLLSEAGAPAVADPGAPLVRLAHSKGIQVVPLTGPSSILLSLMKKLIAISILVVSFTVSNGQTTDSLIISQLYNSALTSTTAYKNLQILTKEAPQRLAGSPGSFLAIKILYNQLKAFDPDTIYLQPVTAYPWDRGEKEVVYATLKNGDKFPMGYSTVPSTLSSMA